jgi:hypothetical protein
LSRNPTSRIGSVEGTAELKQHSWFSDFDWDMLACKKMQSPYIPDIAIDNFDQNHVNNSEWKDAETVKESEL